jgi:predicted nucleic acid-binding protein
VIVLDAGGLYAALDGNEALHLACAASLRAATAPRLLSPFVLAEVDYLVGERLGHDAQLALLDEVARGVYQLEPFAAEDVHASRAVMARYADLRIGLADASVVVLAMRYDTLDLLSTDQRHFRVLTGTRGQPFRLLPYDAAGEAPRARREASRAPRGARARRGRR